MGELNPEVALQNNALRTGIPADVLRVVQSQGNLTFLPPVSVAETYRVGPYNANADSFQFLQGVRSLPEPLPVVESVAAQPELPERLTSDEIMRVGAQTINDLLAKADYEQATPEEKFHLACDLWDIDGDLPKLDFGARASEKPGIIKSIDDSISRTKKVSDAFMTNLKQRDPEAYAMMEKTLSWGATVAQVSAMCNPYTAVGAGAVMVADASGVTGWAKAKIATGLKEIGFEKSSDTMAALVILGAESKTGKAVGKAAAGSKVFNGIVEKAGHKFETAAERFRQNPMLGKQYLQHMAKITELNLHPAQVKELKQALRTTVYEKLTPSEVAKHRVAFERVKDSLRAEWEQNTGKKWPTYTEDIVTTSGKTIPKIGKPYDAHHIIENNHNGPHEWWNIHPAHGVEHHPKIHGSGAPGREIFNGPKKGK